MEAIELSPEHPTRINYIQGIVKIPEGFETVRSVNFEPGKVTFVSITGKQATAAVNWEFLKTGAIQ